MVKREGTFVGTAALNNNKVKKTPAYKNGKRIVKLDISMDASLREQKKPLGLNEMNMLIKNNLVDEIIKTYEVGKKRPVDIYSLDEVWYRKGLTVNEDIPELELHIKVNLLASNMFELRD